MGDAAHTAHFAIGSGTKLAIEDAIELARQFDAHRRRRRAASRRCSRAYQELRRVDVLRLQNAARNAMEWFEVVRRALLRPLEPEQFMYSMLTRSPAHQPREPAPARRATGSRATSAGSPSAPASARRPASRPPPPMFTPFTRARRDAEEPHRRLADGAVLGGRRRGRRLPPRPPRRARDGRRRPGLRRDDLRLADARITPGCPGLWNEPSSAAAGSASSTSCTRNTDAKIGIQLGHAGAKGSTQRGLGRHRPAAATRATGR